MSGDSDFAEICDFATECMTASGHDHGLAWLSGDAFSPPLIDDYYISLMISCFLSLAILGTTLLLEAGGRKNPITVKTFQDFESSYYQRDCL